MQTNGPTKKPPGMVAYELHEAFWRHTCNDEMAKAMPMLVQNPWILQERVPDSISVLRGNPFFHAAIAVGQPELVAYGIAHGAPLEDRCYMGRSALHALVNGQVQSIGKNAESYRELIDSMLATEARCDCLNKQGIPLWFHALSQKHDVWETLIERGSPLDFMLNDGHSGLSWLVGQPDMNRKIMHLVGRGADVNLTHPEVINNAPLIKALAKNNLEMADFLLKNGANIHMKDHLGRGFLHLADDEFAATWLIKNGIELEARDVTASTPLLYALAAHANSDDADTQACLERIAMATIHGGANVHARANDAASSAIEWITMYADEMPNVYAMTLAMKAREVAAQTIKDIARMAP